MGALALDSRGYAVSLHPLFPGDQHGGDTGLSAAVLPTHLPGNSKVAVFSHRKTKGQA